MAEYRELPRVFTLVRNAQSKGKTPDHYQIETYRLGKGHVWFFYKRLSWLLNRYSEIVIELRLRNYNISPIPLSNLVDGIDYLWFNWYIVTPEAMEENRHRIEKRLSGDKT